MDVIQYLEGIYHTLDEISVKGLDNQSKLVGAANAVVSVIQELRKQAPKSDPAPEEGREDP